MKKLCSLIVVALICIIALSACGKEQTKTYEGDVSGKHVLTSITYKDDKVLKQSTINTIKYDDLGMDKDEAKKFFAKSESIFKDLKGVKYKVDYKDKKAIEHLDIDYTEVDMKKLNKRLGVSTKENKDISFEKLEKQLKHRGLKEKDKMDDK
ncbi:YehR family lipoprotein [Staphylococcus aureus]|uniref:YehR family lipoprotein n=1 Tax=Staphylococcus aureus TaxID=1280 RepID=UPI00249B0510